MHSFEDSLAIWTSVISTGLTVVGLFQAREWLTIFGVASFGVSVFAVLQSRRQRERLRAGSIVLEGRRIDSLNAANLARQLNRTLALQAADQLAVITGEDLTVFWRYTGYCRAARETAITLSADSDNSLPFAALNCCAYDLRSDPEKQHPIRPLLVGADGSSKKLLIPLLRPLSEGEAFDVGFRCHLPGCMKQGVEYYASTLAFDQESVPKYRLRLRFVGQQPGWLRVYEVSPAGQPALLRSLEAVAVSGRREYIDTASDVGGCLTRVYLFGRHRGG